jgi:hypothetical protein
MGVGIVSKNSGVGGSQTFSATTASRPAIVRIFLSLFYAVRYSPNSPAFAERGERRPLRRFGVFCLQEKENHG